MQDIACPQRALTQIMLRKFDTLHAQRWLGAPLPLQPYPARAGAPSIGDLCSEGFTTSPPLLDSL